MAQIGPLNIFAPNTIIASTPMNNNFSTIKSVYNAHDIATTGVHGVGVGSIVGTTLVQTLTNKTLTNPIINNPIINGATFNGNVVFDSPTFFIDSVAHRVGIGTITPSQKLEVVGNALVDTNTFFVDSVNHRVGIGTLTPQVKEHIFIGAYGGGGPSANNYFVIESNTDAYLSLLTPNVNNSGIIFGDPENNDAGSIVYSHSGDTMFFSTAENIVRGYFDANGLGVGSDAAPGRIIVINPVDGFRQQSSGANFSSIAMSAVPSLSAAIIQSASGGAGSLLPLAFYMGGSEKMRLMTSGNFGIGTTNALAVLHVASGAYGGGGPSTGVHQIIETSGTSNFLTFLNPSNATAGIIFGDVESNVAASITYDHSVDIMNFSTAENVIRASLGSSGFLGVAKLKSGSYVGNGITPHSITGVGFKPVTVLITRETTSGGANNSFSIHQYGKNEPASDVVHSFFYQVTTYGGATQYLRMDADGFSVMQEGPGSSLNQAGFTYYYTAIG